MIARSVGQDHTAAWLAQTLALFGKDLRAELRTKVALSAVGVFTFASLLLLALATARLKDVLIPGAEGSVHPAWDAQSKMGMLWVLLCFAAFAGLSHSFVHEEETGTVTALRLSMSAEAVYAGKLLFNLVVLIGVTAIVTPAYMLLTGLPVGSPLVFVLVMGCGCLGLGAAATIVAALTAKAQGSGALYGAVGLPLLVVFLILLVKAARTLYLRDVEMVRVVKDVGGLLSFGILLITLSALLFHFVWEE